MTDRCSDYNNISWSNDHVKAYLLMPKAQLTVYKCLWFTLSIGIANKLIVTTPSKPKSKGLPLGPIVGGTFAGFVALVVMIGAGIWYLRRRRNNDRKTQNVASAQMEEDQDEEPSFNMQAQQPYYGELDGRPGLFQLPIEGREKPAELSVYAQDSYTPTEHMHSSGASELAGSSPIAHK